MRSFITRAIAFLLLQAALFTGLVWDPGFPRERGFLAVTIDKHRRLERTPAPRIILAGGSNVPFGFQSALLERELGRPVVNMGLVAGLGPGFMLNELRDAVRVGDVVVLSLEYTLFGGTGNFLQELQVLEYRPASWRFLPQEHRTTLLAQHGLALAGGVVRRSLGLRNRGSSHAAPEFPYVREGFNAYGDYTLHYAEPVRLDQFPASSPLLVPETTPAMSPRLRAHLVAFADLCRQRGARFCFTCPPRPPGLWQANRTAIEGLLAELRSIPDLVVLDQPEEHVYALSLFSDMAYHLTEEGTRQRTLKVAGALRSAGLLR